MGLDVKCRVPPHTPFSIEAKRRRKWSCDKHYFNIVIPFKVITWCNPNEIHTAKNRCIIGNQILPVYHLIMRQAIIHVAVFSMLRPRYSIRIYAFQSSCNLASHQSSSCLDPDNIIKDHDLSSRPFLASVAKCDVSSLP